MVTLLGSSPPAFAGRYVTEGNYSTGSDYCYWSGSSHLAYVSVTGATWGVTSYNNLNDDDYLGWETSDITYYRNNGRSPCQTNLFQSMSINTTSNGWVDYIHNILQLGITYSTVWNQRASVNGEHAYP